MGRGDAAATTWIVRGDGVGRRYAKLPQDALPQDALAAKGATFKEGAPFSSTVAVSGTVVARDEILAKSRGGAAAATRIVRGRVGHADRPRARRRIVRGRVDDGSSADASTESRPRTRPRQRRIVRKRVNAERSATQVITGQNPQSAEELGKAVVAALA